LKNSIFAPCEFIGAAVPSVFAADITLAILSNKERRSAQINAGARPRI
jgi:hypothetical protein